MGMEILLRYRKGEYSHSISPSREAKVEDMPGAAGSRRGVSDLRKEGMPEAARADTAYLI